MTQIPIEILSELHALIEKACEISCTHHEYAASLSKELNETIEDAIHREFLTLYDLHLEKLTAATGTDIYALQLKNAITVPQRRRRWYTFWKTTPNHAAKLVESKIYGKAELYFGKLLDRVEAVTSLLQENSQASTATPPAEAPETEEAPAQPSVPNDAPATPTAEAPEKKDPPAQPLTPNDTPTAPTAEAPKKEEAPAQPPTPNDAPTAPTAEAPEAGEAPTQPLTPNEIWENEDDTIAHETISTPA